MVRKWHLKVGHLVQVCGLEFVEGAGPGFGGVDVLELYEVRCVCDLLAYCIRGVVADLLKKGPVRSRGGDCQ